MPRENRGRGALADGVHGRGKTGGVLIAALQTVAEGRVAGPILPGLGGVIGERIVGFGGHDEFDACGSDLLRRSVGGDLPVAGGREFELAFYGALPFHDDDDSLRGREGGYLPHGNCEIAENI